MYNLYIIYWSRERERNVVHVPGMPPVFLFVCRCHYVFLWCWVCFVLLRFRLYAFIEAASLCSMVVDMQASHTRVSFCLFVYLEMSLFPSISCTIAVFHSYGVVRFFLPDGIFLPCDHGLDF